MNRSLLKFSGISLLEILITVVIVTLLCTMSVYSYQAYKTKTLYSNSMNIMEQNKSIIYSYFSKYKECPTTEIIGKTLDPNNHIGNRIVNSQCDIVLCQDTIEILSLNATISNDILNTLTDGISYQCNFLSSAGFENIDQFLPQCRATTTANRCSI